MKKIVYLFFLIVFFSFISEKMDAQVLCHGDTIVVNVTGHSGSLQWQVSDDQIIWTNIPGAITDTLIAVVRSIKYYRARVTTGTCVPFYSDILSVTAEGCPCPGTPTVTDVNGNVYPTIRIGAQCWMAKNLNTGAAQFNNVALSTTSVQKYCYGASNTNADPFNNCQVHGGLYTWEAAMQGAASTNAVPSGIQGVCPVGWHLPSDDEWKVLELELELPNPELIGWRGHTQGIQLKVGGTSNFDGLFSGKRDYNSEYKEIDDYGYFWTTTQSSPTNAWLHGLWDSSNGVGRFANHKNNALSVRCVKD